MLKDAFDHVPYIALDNISTSDDLIILASVWRHVVDPMVGTALVNGEEMELLADDTVTSIVLRLGLKPEHVAVELNGDICRRSEHAIRKIVDGDTVEIVSFVGGG